MNRPSINSAEFLKTLSDAAICGAIRQLSASGDWPKRLWELRREVSRRGSKRRKSA